MGSIIGGTNSGEGNYFYHSGGILCNAPDKIIGNYFSGAQIVATSATIIGNVVVDQGGIIAHSCKLMGNYIGVDRDGVTIKNNQNGISVWDSVVGGNSKLGEGNLIIGNWDTNVQCMTGNTICGNRIESTSASSAYGYGICVHGENNVIGKNADGYGNIISGNKTGIVVLSNKNKIQNNVIGLSSTGAKMPNTVAGITVSGATNLIGGGRNAGRYERNVISGNPVGVYVTGTGNTICGNLVGMDITGANAIGNQTGIDINGSANLVGGTNADTSNVQGNVISGQYPGTGINMEGGKGNAIQGNYIGLNLQGDSAMLNSTGISLVTGNTATSVGGTLPGQGNFISGNSIGVNCANSAGHVITGNCFGTNAAGTGILSNVQDALVLTGTGTNRIGGVTAGERNVICGNSEGLLVSSSSGNTVTGNWFGVLPNGSSSPACLTTGINLAWSNNNFIGLQNSGNLINNTLNGIVMDSNSQQNRMYGNTICAFIQFGINLASGANGNKVWPTIGSANTSLVSGTSGNYDYIELFVSDRGLAHQGGSLSFAGSTTANYQGVWNLTPINTSGASYVCAVATDKNGNSSGFSPNAFYIGPTAWIDPAYCITGKPLKLTVTGSGLNTASVAALVRTGNPTITSSSVIQNTPNSFTYSFDLGNAASSDYDVRVTNNNGCQSILKQALGVLTPLTSPVGWSINDLNTAGGLTYTASGCGLEIGDADRDNNQEIYVANFDQCLYKFTKFTFDWTPSPLPATAGLTYTRVMLAYGDGDQVWEAYATASDNHVYQFKNNPTWQRMDLGAGSASATKQCCLARADVDHDGFLEIYAAGDNGVVSQFKYNGASWTRADIPGCPTTLANALAAGDGKNDYQLELYSANALDQHIYQYLYSGSAWQVSPVGQGQGVMNGVAVGDGDNDGQREVYAACQDGKIYQYRWKNGSWSGAPGPVGSGPGPIGLGNGPMTAVAISDADNDGSNEVYAACADGHVYAFKYDKAQRNWATIDLGNAGTPLYALAIGDAGNDHHFEVYALGQNNHVFQFQAATVPTATPTPTLITTTTATPTTTPTATVPQSFFKVYHSQINPTRGEQARISWSQPQDGPVSIKIYNLLGDRVATLVDGSTFAANEYQEITWNGRTSAGSAAGSGIYVVDFQAGSFKIRGKIAIVK
jgi:hypothetical protein